MYVLMRSRWRTNQLVVDRKESYLIVLTTGKVAIFYEDCFIDGGRELYQLVSL